MCGDVPGTAVLSNAYGWGRLDVKAAYGAVPPAAPDIDASITATKYDALTDGLLALRHLFSLRGVALIMLRCSTRTMHHFL